MKPLAGEVGDGSKNRPFRTGRVRDIHTQHCAGSQDARRLHAGLYREGPPFQGSGRVFSLEWMADEVEFRTTCSFGNAFGAHFGFPEPRRGGHCQE